MNAIDGLESRARVSKYFESTIVTTEGETSRGSQGSEREAWLHVGKSAVHKPNEINFDEATKLWETFLLE